MATSKRTIINSIAVLRILTLASCAAALALIVTNNFKLDGDKTKFSDIKGFRYVLAAAAGGVLYSLIQLPFALYHAVKEKRLIKGDFLPMFEFYGDKYTNGSLLFNALVSPVTKYLVFRAMCTDSQ
nr:CASP-like protein 4D1 [Nicotiana tomentosiformis]